MYHVRVTFLLRSRGVSVTYLYSYGISLRMFGVSRRMCYVCVTYVWRTKCKRDASVAYLFCANCFLIPMRTNGCVHFVHAIRTLQLSIIRGRRCHRRNLDNLDYHRRKTPRWWWLGGGGISKLPILVVTRHEQRQRLHQA